MSTRKIKAAITGGIGSGKSSFAEYLHKKGCPVLKADDISKEILSSNEAVKKKIIQTFGSEAFHNGVPDKKYLAEKVFSSPENVLLINSILHPLVLKRLSKEMDELLNSNEMVFVEAALVYEADMEDMFDYVVLITADDELKLMRKTAQDKITAVDFHKRNENQIPDEEKKKRADFIFTNNGTKEELQQKAELLLVMLKNLSGR